MDSTRFWFLDWLDDNGVADIDGARALLASRPELTRLRQRAEDALANYAPRSAESAIVAGAGIDLSGQFGCSEVSCRLAKVDELFRRAWLYFDQIIVADTISPLLIHGEGLSSDAWLSELLTHIQVVLYLKDIGAISLVDFQSKSHRYYCKHHASETLASVGAAELISQLDDHIARVKSEITIHDTHRLPDGSLDVCITHPLFGDLLYVFRTPSGDPTEVLDDASRVVVASHVSALITDAAVARDLNLPLGTAERMQAQWRESSTTEIDVNQIAFEIDLPILDRVSISDLIRIRSDEADAFDRFRLSLRRAIRDRLNEGVGAAGDEIAKQIKEDVILPELYNIQTRLRVARNALAKKAALGASVGALVTSFGLISGLLPLTLMGVGIAGAASVQPGQQYFERKSEIELSEMYFLWKTVEHSRDK